nr:uncharacterized protein LOC124494506 [Dermatophagoides farinae]
MSLNECWLYMHNIWTLRCWRMKRILIFSLIIMIIIIIIYLAIVLNSKNKNSISEHSTTITYERQDSGDSEINDDGFSSLRRQHRLKETNSNLGDDEQINRPSLNIDQSLRNSTAKAKHLVVGNGDSKIFSRIKCRNSAQGKLLITDDRGHVCQRQHIIINGCCDDLHFETKKFVCDTCQTNGCCEIYEHCVSCCMAPENRDHLNRMINGDADFDEEEKKMRESLQIFFSSITDLFELCLIKCRTSSASVRHENTYKNHRTKHCYTLMVTVDH